MRVIAITALIFPMLIGCALAQEPADPREIRFCEKGWAGVVTTCTVYPPNKYSVIDAQCRVKSLNKCVEKMKGLECGVGGTKLYGKILGADVHAFRPCPGEQYSSTKTAEEICALEFETHPGECIRNVDSLTAEADQKETNNILRSDMRLLLNQFCKSYSPRPESCDTTIPVQK